MDFQFPPVAQMHLGGVVLAWLEGSGGAVGVQRQPVESWTRLECRRETR